MAGVEIDTQDLDELRAALLRSSSSVPAQMDKAVRRIAESVVDAARRKVPRGPSGAARASLRVVGSSGTETLVGGDHRAKYFGWLDFGGRTGIRKTVKRPFKRAGRYIYPALVSKDTFITSTLEGARDNVVKAGGLGGG